MRYGICFLAAAMLFSAGCGNSMAKDPRIILAKKCREEGDFQAAERQILNYLASHPESAEAHLLLASLYDEAMSDPVGAAFHYREVLRLEPGSPQAEEIRAWMLEAQKKCAPAAPPSPASGSADVTRLQEENAVLRQELAKRLGEIRVLQAQNPSLSNSVKFPSVSGSSVKKTVVSEGVSEKKQPVPEKQDTPAEYVVRQGDSLGKIARRFYGSASKIDPIMTANKLTEKSVLKIGQKLVIPKIKR